jgi:protein-tyrosine phosphatase
MVDEADVVFAMTRSHAAAVTEMAPGAASKVHLLNPRGEDIPDPIGAGQERYTALAREMTPMIQRRLREMEP